MSERILLLGATGGIGAALARRVHARGATPVLLARDAAKLAALATELPGSEAVQGDVLALPALPPGPLAGLAFCVGSILVKPAARTTEAEMLDAFRLNALAAAKAVQAALPALVEGRGSVVLFSSVAARTGFGGHLAISMAKAAVEGMTVALAAELAPQVRVNCIAPSLTRTGIAEPLTRNAAMAEAIARTHPVNRLGEAEDSAALADFLLSPAAGWITGQVMAVDGGRSSLRAKGG
ncbi:SDR family NAD(P)-dependent oxidoreductase [Roseococcus sp. DSY-14]|uniref:SDR family NAD(P)-dependent oxidoreductase n=1 Tax=Roseococcus sp. DSY-14 TaxID=3369650 RepID=UPI00387ABD06